MHLREYWLLGVKYRGLTEQTGLGGTLVMSQTRQVYWTCQFRVTTRLRLGAFCDDDVNIQETISGMLCDVLDD